MTQEERLSYLIRELCKESDVYRRLQAESGQQRRLLRALMNLRMPGSVSREFLEIQDAFLKQEAKEKGIVDVSKLPSVKEAYDSAYPFADRIVVWQGDITRLKADMIVNAANSQLLGCFVPCHGCIDNAIHSAAGIQLREECNAIMEAQGHEEKTGGAKLTKGYNLPARYVVHTVGPIVRGELTTEDMQMLQSCYESCLETAEEQEAESIVFCCISTGEFGFPNKEASQIAADTVEKWLSRGSKIKRIVFNVFKDDDLELYKEIFTAAGN